MNKRVRKPCVSRVRWIPKERVDGPKTGGRPSAEVPISWPHQRPRPRSRSPPAVPRLRFAEPGFGLPAAAPVRLRSFGGFGACLWHQKNKDMGDGMISDGRLKFGESFVLFHRALWTVAGDVPVFQRCLECDGICFNMAIR